MEELPVRRIAELIEGAAAVAGQADLPDLLKATVNAAQELTGARYAALGVLGQHGTLVNFVHIGVTDEEAKAIGHLPEGRGVLGALGKQHEPLLLEDLRAHPSSVGFPPNHPIMQKFLGVSIRIGEERFGNLYLTDSPASFSPADAAVITALARVVGAAIATARINERLRRLAVVEDRERIARDLHDGIIQDLFAVGLMLQTLQGSLGHGATNATLDDAVARLDQAIGGLRSYVFELPAPRDLRQELERLVTAMGAVQPSRIRLTIEGDVSSMPASLAGEALNILREALSNALRHSDSKSIEVRLADADAELTLQVEDDGVGFDVSQPSTGMGLSNLRWRAERSGGQFELSSSPGKGTRVRVTLPR